MQDGGPRGLGLDTLFYSNSCNHFIRHEAKTVSVVIAQKHKLHSMSNLTQRGNT